MNADHLESLLLDRELGELSPAVAALLDHHLAADPAAARRAAELRTTVQLARRAVAVPVAAPPRPLDLGALRRPAPAPSPFLVRPELYRLAACLALGLGLGWLARPLPTPDGTGRELAPPATAIATTPAEPRSNFWSVARLTATQRPPTVPGTGNRRPFR